MTQSSANPSRAKFPANREKSREFCRFRHSAAILASRSSSEFNVFQVNSLCNRTRNFFHGAGSFCEKTGKLIKNHNTTIDQVWAGRTYISQRTSPEVAISGLLRVLAMTKSKKGSGRPKGIPYFGFAEAAKAGGNVAGFNQAAFYPGPEAAEDREAAIQKYVEVRARAARGGKANVGDKAKKRKILADVLAETP
jgi:hypothetical protein